METRALTDAYEKTGGWSPRRRRKRSGLAVYADDANGWRCRRRRQLSLEALLGAHIKRPTAATIRPARLCRPRHEHIDALQKVRTPAGPHPCGHLRWASGRGSCIRPARPTRAGRTAASSSRSPADGEDMAVPGRKFSFGLVERAQAKGDYDVLAERGRRLIRVDIGQGVERG